MKKLLLLAGWVVVASVAVSATLADEFIDSPKASRPEAWFHVLAGNISTNGLRADLAAIKKGGFSGIQFFHEDFGGAWPGVTNQTRCLSENWDAYVRFAAEECRRLGLTFKLQNCPGWSMAGGPWIAPTNAMRDLVFSRTLVSDASSRVTVKRPDKADDFPWRDYRDIAVVAFLSPAGESVECLQPVSVQGPRAFAGSEHRHYSSPWARIPQLPRVPMLDGAELDASWLRGFSSAGTDLGFRGPGEERFVVDFGHEVTVRTLALTPVQAMNHDRCYAPEVKVKIEVEKIGGGGEIGGWRVLREVEVPKSNWQDNSPLTLAIPETTARRFRLTLKHRHDMAFAFARFYSRAMPDNWEADAAYVLRSRLRGPHAPLDTTACVDPKTVVDLTTKLRADGTLDWTPPKGRWTVLRIGHVNAGHRNSPAPEAATGWECDKLSDAGADAHYDGFVGRLAKGPLAGGLLDGILLDSWECCSQTWTPGLGEDYRKELGRGLCWPALCGYVCGDREATREFLATWRRFLSDRVSRRFYGRLAERARADGLSIAYETAGGDVFPGDMLDYWRHADVPMCEFWQPRTESFVGSDDFKPILPCASAAHLYGKRRVDAESFTGMLTWREKLSDFIDVANCHFAQGVTHNVIQGWIHDPRPDDAPSPGGSLGNNGTPFNRRQKWIGQLDEFTAYLARCTLILERGVPVRDVLLYVGDDVDHVPPAVLSNFPDGYKYDYCTQDALLTRLEPRDGAWRTPDGICYSTIWTRDTPYLCAATSTKLAQGASSGSQVVTNLLSAALPPPDVVGAGRSVVWEHRREGEVDRYFVATDGHCAWKGTLSFRATGAVSLWNPQDGSIVAVEWRAIGDRTEVSLNLPPSGCVFVVFDRTGAQPSHAQPAEKRRLAAFESKTSTWFDELLVDQARPASERKTWTTNFPSAALTNNPCLRWDFASLCEVPKAERMPELDTNGVEAVMLEGLPWKGSRTKFFAYVAIPEAAKAGKPVPGVVLVHGGMSTASASWCAWWRERGYAAIAADNCGGLPIAEKDGSWRRHAFSGPPGWGRFATCDEPIKDQWFYHAVAVNILAQTYLGSLVEVDSKRIGLVGGSWGGLLSCCIAAVDPRFKFAVPVFGCGYLGTHHFVSWRLGLQGAKPEHGEKWLKLWDPSLFLPYAKCPFLWVDGTNDFHFQLDMVMRSAELVRDNVFATIVRLPHSSVGTQRHEIAAFADYHLRSGRDLVRIYGVRFKDGVMSATFDANGRTIAGAKLVWTESDDPDWTKRVYVERQVDILDVKDVFVSARVPKTAKVFYLMIETDDGLVSSGKVKFRFGQIEN